MGDRTKFTFAEVDALFRYDKEAGKVYWKVDKARASAGDEAGTIRKNGYKDIKFNGKRTSYARVCWCLHYGAPPEQSIDHIDGNPQNNKIGNLRDVSHSQNMKNRAVPTNNTHGVLGIKFDKRSKKWAAAIGLNGSRLWLGTFNKKGEAIKARIEAEKKYYGSLRRAS